MVYLLHFFTGSHEMKLPNNMLSTEQKLFSKKLRMLHLSYSIRKLLRKPNRFFHDFRNTPQYCKRVCTTRYSTSKHLMASQGIAERETCCFFVSQNRGELVLNNFNC